MCPERKKKQCYLRVKCSHGTLILQLLLNHINSISEQAKNLHNTGQTRWTAMPCLLQAKRIPRLRFPTITLKRPRTHHNNPSVWTRPSFINASWSDNTIVGNQFHPSKHKTIRGERCERQYGNKYGTYLQISPRAARSEKILRVVWLLFLNIFLFSLVTSSKNGLNVSGWVTESTRREHSKLKCQITLAILLPKGHAWWLVRKYVPECSLESHWTKPEWTGV